jgi:DNA-binding transcriptional ArsR family regulator
MNHIREKSFHRINHSSTQQKPKIKNHSTNLDSIFSALADSTRRTILDRLAQGTLSVTEIAKPFQISLPAISKHLRVLEKAGLIVRERDGRIFRCRIDATPLIVSVNWLARYRPLWEEQLDKLAGYLAETTDKGNA